MPKRRTTTWLFRLLLTAIPAVAAAAANAAERPNVVLVLCDDLGYGDLGCYNEQSKIHTPRLNALATAGVRFRDAHSGSAVCTPTRYGLMTGRYAWRTRLKQGVLGGLSPRLIEPDRLTLAGLFAKCGYRTACIGKWHLGLDWHVLPGKTVNELGIESPEQVHHVDYSKPFAGGPLAVGFHEFFGIAASLDMVPYTFLRGDRVAAAPTVDKDFAMMAGRTAGRTRLGPGAPDFEDVNVLPALTREALEFIARQADESRRGNPFFLYLPLASPHTPIAPSAEWSGKSGINRYADFVMQTDDAIGQIITAIDDRGLGDHTIVIVASDNGASPESKFDELQASGHDSNGGLRGHKADIFEGGHRVPLIVRWLGRTPPGAVSDRLTCLSDFMATFAEILGEPLPPNAGEDSLSMLSALMGQPEPATERGVVHHSANGSFAIRQGDWKLVLCADSGGWSYPRPGRDDVSELPPVQLFNLRDDPQEMHNIQHQHSPIVARLKELLADYVQSGHSSPNREKRTQASPARPN